MPTLYLLSTRADAQADLGLTGEPSGRNAGPHALELLLSRLQQHAPLVRAQLRQLRIAAGDEPLARIVRVRELEEIALIEEPELQHLALHQGADLAALERGDPGQALKLA